MPPLKPSKKAFGPALTNLMKKKKLSYRQLSELTKTADPTGKGLSSGFLHNLTSGVKEPLIERVELIARAVDVDPVHFREYREHELAREACLTAARIGYDGTITALKELRKNSK